MRRLGVEIESFDFPPGRSEYVPATRRLRLLLRRERFDLVHAHYGLAGWCARLAGARPLLVSFHGTDVRHWLVGPLSRRLAWRADLVAAVSRSLFAPEDGRPGPARPYPARRSCPAARTSRRFRPMPRQEARRRLGPRPQRPLPPLPRQPEPAREAPRPRRRAGRRLRCRAAHRRRDRPRPDAALGQRRQRGTRHLRLRGLRPRRRSRPLPATCPSSLPRSGSPPTRSPASQGTLCAPFDRETWSAAARPLLDSTDPRVSGAARAASLSAARMAERTMVAYRELIAAAR